MDQQEFIEELKQKVLEWCEGAVSEENIRVYPDGFSDPAELTFIRETNLRYHRTESDTLIGSFLVITFQSGGSELICRFEISGLSEEYKKTGWEPLRKIVDNNRRIAELGVANELLTHIDDYEIIKERLFVRPINYSRNKYDLKDAIFERHGDIALVLYILLQDDPETGISSTKARVAMCDTWGQDREEIFRTALINTNVLAPPRLYIGPLDCIDPPYERGAFMALNYRKPQIGNRQIPLITTTRQRNGAIAMFYPGVKEKLAEILGGDFYIGFTSVDDARVHPTAAWSPRTVLSSLKNVNKNANEPEDVLTNKVYLYDAAKQELRMLEL